MDDAIKDIDLDNPEFKQIEALIAYTNSSVFMTGKAGTGKSTFLKYITKTTKKKYVVLAPTGIAAVNVGGQTLHSFFHLPFKPLMPDDPEFSRERLGKRMKYSKQFVKLLRELDLIIIDEISMVRADTIDFIDKLLRYYCRNERQPFGGKPLLMVGDVFQLEPVVTTQAREILRNAYSWFFFFSARVFTEIDLVPIELRKVYRQTDSEFISMLDRVRAGMPEKTDLMTINARVDRDAVASARIGGKGDMTMTIATRREIVDFINESHLAELKSPPLTFEAEVKDDFPESSYPTDRLLTLKIGAQVVFIRNDMDKRWVNGTLGRVHTLSANELRVELENGERHTIEPEMWGNVEYRYDEESKAVTEHLKGSFKQYPVKLAWALTIHKSQGLTFKKIIIDVGQGAFTGGQSYVALSRCTSLEGITLASPLRESDIYVNAHVLRFAREFNNPRRVNGAMESARADQLYAEAAGAFNKGDYALAVETFAEASALRPVLGNRTVRKAITQKLYALTASRRRVAELEARVAAMQDTLNALSEEFVILGRNCLDEGWDADPAIANFKKALSLNPHNYDAKVGLGRAYIQNGAQEEAMDLLGKAAREYERHEAPYELGSLFLAIGDLSNALHYLKKSQKINPRAPEIHDALADAYEVADDPEQAARHRNQARKLRGN